MVYIQYVLDSNVLISFKHYYLEVFKSFWDKLQILKDENKLVSVYECFNEVNGSVEEPVQSWILKNKDIFLEPQPEEYEFLVQMFQNEKYRETVSKKALEKGTFSADSYIIAKAYSTGGTVVTEEKYKPNSAKIPTICKYFNIPCINSKEMMVNEKMSF
jgi:hypothetical protein